VKLKVVLCLFLVLLVGASSFASKIVDLKFYFPVQVAGPLAVLMDNLVSNFNTQNPGIKVSPIYSGNYDQTLQKAITSARGGNPPDVALLLSTDLFTLRDLDLVENIDGFLGRDDSSFFDEFYEGFMENSTLDGKRWSVPFQRSTPIFYYNKEDFKKAGLDPENPPKTWDELLADAKLLTKKDSGGNVVTWGFEDITDDTWTIQALILQAGGQYANEQGTESYFDSAEANEAVSFWNKLANVYKVMPRHRSYGSASQDFVAGATAMMFNSTGSLSFVKSSANFQFGVAPLPAGKMSGVPTGGGNLYIFKNISKSQKAAAWKFVKWLSQPEISAKWSINTGYIPVRKDAFETQQMKDYVEKFPYVLVARDQLENAHREMSFHSNSQIREAFLTHLQSILDEKISASEGLKDLQEEVKAILEPFNE
jgi:sn-glycerol 3-phosphate transport system substrate-binding protein